MHTQICGMILLLVIYLLKALQPTQQAKTYRLYSVLLFSGAICLLLDIFSLVVLENAGGEYDMFVRGVCKLYLVSLVLTVGVSFLYLTKDLEERISFLPRMRWACVLWVLGMSVGICTHQIMVHDADGRFFTYGPSANVTYVAAGVVLLSNIVVLIRFKKYMNTRRWQAGVIWMVLWVFAAVIQFYSGILLVGFAMSVGIMIVFIQMETPDYQNLVEAMAELEESRLEASQASQAKSNFLAQMSHEIRTPINAVIGMNEMILREAREENIQEYARNVYSAGMSLLAIINDILDISKIEAGKMELVPTEYELVTLIRDCYHTVNNRAEDKGLNFCVECEESLPGYLCGDMVRIRQIILNLLTNAIKYTDRGRVTFSVGEGHREADKLELVIQVKDTGIGMSEENLTKLFDNFERFDMKRNQKIEGTGLGLAITKKLVDLMDGTIRVESKYGVGSVFTVTLPQWIADDTPIGEFALQQKTIRQHSTDAWKWLRTPQATILAVDDVEINLMVFCSMLKSTEIRIVPASGGEEAVSLAEQQKFDLIFMDHMMPGMNGIEAFHQIRDGRKSLNRKTPVIMLTANAIASMREEYLQEGFTDYLSKPIDSNALYEMLEKYLPREKISYETGNGVEEQKPARQNPDSLSERFAVIRQMCGDFNLEEAVMHCSGSEEFFVELLKDFATPERVEELETAFREKNWEFYVTKVHALKGTMRTFGFPKLGDMAEGLQFAAERRDEAYLSEHHGEAMRLLEAIVECVKGLQ